MAVNQNAMYRAGFARGTKGRNVKVEKQLARQERLVNFGYDVVGMVTEGVIQDGFNSLQKFRDAQESQTSSMQLAIDKVPRENTNLTGAIRQINANYRDAAKRSRWSIGEKRKEAKAEMGKWMTQMKDLNAFLELYRTGATESQGYARVSSGVAGEGNKGGNVRLSGQNLAAENLNTWEQANGDMAMNLNWNLDEGTMYVARGGKWTEDQNGKRVYISKGIGENKDLQEKYNAYKEDFENKQNDIKIRTFQVMKSGQ
mgnify:CR=1 FL=1